MPVPSTARLAVRALAREDLPAVVAIDATLSGRTRRAYIERRLAAALQEPRLHAQFAVRDAGGLAGYILARVLEGEFGRVEPGLRLEMVGVRADRRGTGVGARLLEALAQWAQRHGVGEVRTVAPWRDTAMLHWLDTMGFDLAPVQVLASTVDGGAYRPERDDVSRPQNAQGPAAEVNFGVAPGNDFDHLARDVAEVASMTRADLAQIAGIDRGITGHDRSGYIAARLAEAMDDSSIRVSLVARRDGAIAGYLMARADLGDYGRTEPVAVIDTLGVAPEHAKTGIGHALLSQLFANLGALRVESVETMIDHSDLALVGFFHGCGFVPAQRLSFVKRLP